MRPVWSGSLTFGLVTVPVRLYSAVEDHTVHFRQFERGTSDRIRYRRVNERTGDEVDYADVVKGYELDDGEYVLVEPGELDEIAPGRSKALEVEQFADLAEVDPMFFDKTYWLAPAKEEFAQPYALLLAAMAKTDKAGVAKFVLRGREYLALVRAGEGVMLLNTLHFAADLRDPAKELPDLPDRAGARGKELDLAVNLIEAMTDEWRPGDHHDTYTDRVHELIDAKSQGRTVTPAEEAAEPTKVVELFEALQRSVEKGRGGAGKKRSARKKQPDLKELSKAELEELAREREVKGRSKMNRAALEKALKAS
ncbi:Ku protein [Amycolatopsis sp. PS_44_ISF1]|uniref:non-homologous end joining protein Ku n=1 Tax=Amycolatopsis sp. PS_44_ISF1 TaxID=2974917 RepID=UPI0028DD9A0B|nr:Ku protein [Amycolatopsis sp. PS_44_ISF1]MDT8914923.1 Ku protein [Amycolatopsis sp. PS_44_ISF1]